MQQETGRLSGLSMGLCADATPRDRANQRRFLVWILAWAIAFVAATWLLKNGVVPAGPAAWLVALAPTLIGIGAVWSYLTFLRQADELTQRIQLESLAWAFGVGVLFMTGYRLFERTGAPALDIDDALVVMMFVWAAAQVVVARHYR
jgi:hypothetical protein